MNWKQFKFNFLRRLIHKYCYLFGVQFEGELPPEFIITHHAKQRLAERVGVSAEKMKKITMKAWNCKDRVKKITHNRTEYFYEELHGRKIHLRSCMGYTFVFDKRYQRGLPYPQKILITVYN